MHRLIVEALESVLEKYQSRHNEMLWTVYVAPRKNTDGFWRVCVVAEEGREHFLPHIRHIAESIGRLFGEGLCTQQKGDRLMLS